MGRDVVPLQGIIHANFESPDSEQEFVETNSLQRTSRSPPSDGYHTISRRAKPTLQSPRAGQLAMSNTTVQRPFHLVDAIVLIAATAIGVVPARNSLTRVPELVRQLGLAVRGVELRGHSVESLIRDPDRNWVGKIGVPIGELPGEVTLGWALFNDKGPELAKQVAIMLCIDLWPLLICWGGALLILRLRRPRPPLREIPRQPGFWACFAPFAAMYYFTVWCAGQPASWHPATIPLGIVGVWLLLWGSKRGDRKGDIPRPFGTMVALRRISTDGWCSWLCLTSLSRRQSLT